MLNRRKIKKQQKHKDENIKDPNTVVPPYGAGKKIKREIKDKHPIYWNPSRADVDASRKGGYVDYFKWQL